MTSRERRLAAAWPLTVAAVLALALAGAGCRDDVTDPDSDDRRLTMENMWPHADGASWAYDMSVSTYGGLEPRPAVPPLPSYEQMYAALATTPAGTPDSVGTGRYTLRLDGTVTTGSGITAQHLVEGYEDVMSGARAADGQELGLLRLLAAARPRDRAVAAALERALESGRGGDAKRVASPPLPQFLSGYAFSAEDDGYYSYGDLSTEHSWKYLEGALEEGTEFSIQLVPMLVDDLWLRARIWSVGSRTIDGVRWRNLVEVFYVVDMGSQTVTGESGETLGYLRNYLYGTVLYAPGVGPIACDEHHVYGPSSVIQDATTGGLMTFRCRYTGPVTP